MGLPLPDEEGDLVVGEDGDPGERGGGEVELLEESAILSERFSEPNGGRGERVSMEG